ncbi:MAG: hypothetical protein ACOC22_00620 [bacterium]
MKFPREVCNPRRVPCKSMKKFLEFVNKNISNCNLFTNVYNFTEFSEKGYPVYSTAIPDRIWFDFDIEKKDKKTGEIIKLPAYKNMLRLHEWLKTKDILHFPRFTGSGYDLTVFLEPNMFLKNKKNAISNAVLHISEELGIESDPQTIGDLSRICRITNTFNHKQKARRYCIPLDENIIYEGHEKIKEYAKNQRRSNNKYGTKYLDISEFDNNTLFYDNFEREKIDIDSKDFSDLSKNTPDCVKYLLAKKEPNWKERRPIILFLKDNCYTQQECINILKNHLSQKKFIHCVKEEKQVKHLYKNEKYVFPNQKEMKEIGACPRAYGDFCECSTKGCMNYGRDKKH